MASNNVTINLNFNADFFIELLIRYTMYEFNCNRQQAEWRVLKYMNRSNDND